MRRAAFSNMRCSVARTLDVIGDPWTPLVLRDLALGITRFDQIQRDLGISRKVLTERLAALTAHGVVERTPYQERPPRYDYLLTDKGAELGLVLLAMQAWGDRWVFGEGSEPLVLHHVTCGQRARPHVTCSCCGEPLRRGEVIPDVGPGGGAGPGTHEIPAAIERIRALLAVSGDV